MSDEEIITDGADTDTLSENDAPSDTITYCTVNDVTDLFGSNIPDTSETQLIQGAIRRATAQIHMGLRKRRVPLPDRQNYSSGINAIATYFAACDCYGSLHNGGDYQTEDNLWCKKAREALEDYCDAYWETCAEEEEQIQHTRVKHSHGLTYNQKRRRW